VITKKYVLENYFGGKETTNFKKQIKYFGILSISQSELLKSDGKYKLSSDVNLEVMVTRMHKKSINVGNQLKPKKIK
jgi:hypothetical protein